MGYLQKFSYSNIENINDYMSTVKDGAQLDFSESTTEVG